MTFKQQVESLTGLTISDSSNPTQDELSQFLTDGAVDVINTMIEIAPQEAVKFTTTTTDSNNDGITVTGKSVSIVREHDSATILRPCTLISAQDRYEATNKESIKYRSKYNPGYFILDGKIFSVPDSASGNNGVKVTQISYPTIYYTQDSIITFPNEFEYLVVIYAAPLNTNASEYFLDKVAKLRPML
jgi:hypothetical protein